MKRKFILPLIIFLSLFIFPSSALAAGPISLEGTATVVNTGGELLFEEYNSDVVVDSATGYVTGFVWSEDLGWIDFGNDGEADPVIIDLDDGTVSGLAYVVNTGGHIDFTNFDSNTEVDISTGIFTGYVWSEDLGWIDFTGVTIDGPLVDTGFNTLPFILSLVLTISIILVSFVSKQRMNPHHI